MDDLERLQIWLHEWLLAEERKRSDNLTEYWNRLQRRPDALQAAFDYVRAISEWDDFIALRNTLWGILDTFKKTC